MHVRRFLAPLLGLAIAASTQLSASAASTGAWARPGMDNVAVYFRLANAHYKPLALVGASTPVAGHVSIHHSYETAGGDHAHMNMAGGMHMAGGMQMAGGMAMEPVDSITVMPNKFIELSPGGYHLMLTRLKHPLKLGERFPLTLRYRDKSTETIKVVVTNR